jgi:DNA-directed RNA polymerase subunit RPC12/RpoP
MDIRTAIADMQKSPSDHFAIRDAHVDHIKAPTWRLRALPLFSGRIGLESDDGDGYRFTTEDLDAEDWTVHHISTLKECPACAGDFRTADEITRNRCWYCGGKVTEKP